MPRRGEPRGVAAQCHCHPDRSAALGHHKGPRQSGGRDARVRRDRPCRDPFLIGVHAPTGVRPGSGGSANRVLAHHDGGVPQRDRPAGRCVHAGIGVQGSRICHGVHRQVAPRWGGCRRGRTGTTRPAGWIPAVVGERSARIHVGCLPDGAVGRVRATRAADRLPVRRADGRCGPVRRRSLRPPIPLVRVTPGATSPEWHRRPAPAGYRERYEGRWLPPDLAALSPAAPNGGAHRYQGATSGRSNA